MNHVLADVLNEIEQEDAIARAARLEQGRHNRLTAASEWGREQGAKHLARYRETHPRTSQPRTPAVRAKRKRVPMPRKNPLPQTQYLIHQSPRLLHLLALATESIAADRQIESVPDPKSWRYKQATPKNKVRMFRSDGSLIVTRAVSESIAYWARHVSIDPARLYEESLCYYLENARLGFENGTKRPALHIMLYPEQVEQLDALATRLAFLPIGKPSASTVIVMAICAAAYATGKAPPLCTPTP